MHYAFLIYHDEETRGSSSGVPSPPPPLSTRLAPPSALEAEIAKHAPYIEMLRRNRQYVASDLLEPTRSAWTLRKPGGRPIVSQGPFAESREQFGGYYVVDATDLDVALDLAYRCPSLTARGGEGIEIRPTERVSWTAPTTQGAISRPSWNRFLLAAYRDESVEEDRDEAIARWSPWVEQLRASGNLASAEALAPSGSATLLRLRNGKTELTDSPFREGGPQLCATFVVWARDVDEAIELASRCPEASPPLLETRPIRRTVD